MSATPSTTAAVGAAGAAGAATRPAPASKGPQAHKGPEAQGNAREGAVAQGGQPASEPQDRVELSAAAQQASRPYDVPDESKEHPPADESERTPEVAQKQNAAVEEALRTNQPVKFTNSEGREVEVSVHKTDTGYSYELDAQKAPVTFSESYNEQDRTEALGKLLDYASQVPPYARDTYTSVNFAEPKPANGNARTVAAFDPKDRSLNFYGKDTVTEGTYNHEVGHAVGYKANGSSFVPKGWSEAVERDQKEVSGYGKSSRDGTLANDWPWDRWFRGGHEHADDFAEAYSAYSEARESGPEALQKFREKYPERARILDQYFEQPLVDSPMPSPLGDQPVYA